jgi:hypothetical protein
MLLKRLGIARVRMTNKKERKRISHFFFVCMCTCVSTRCKKKQISNNVEKTVAD